MVEEMNRSIDPYLADKILHGYGYIKKGDDFTVLITGETGAGKTTLGAQIGYKLGKLGMKFGPESILFDPWEFARAIDTKTKSVLILDEAIMSLLNRNAQTKASKAVITSLVMGRSGSNCIIIIIPSPYLLDWYAAFERVHLWLHCFITIDKKTGQERKGSLCIYPKQNILDWYWKGQKFRKVLMPAGRIGKARFFGWFPLDHEKYDRKKRDAKRKHLGEQEGKKTTKKPTVKDFRLISSALHDKYRWSDRKIAELYSKAGISRVTGRRISQTRGAGPDLEAGSEAVI